MVEEVRKVVQVLQEGESTSNSVLPGEITSWAWALEGTFLTIRIKCDFLLRDHFY